MMRMFVVAGCTLALGGCATAIRGTDEAVTFQSEPSGAQVTTSTGLACPQTPCTIQIPRSDQFTATFTKEGFAPEQVGVATKIAGTGAAAAAGNIIAGGLIGVGVDAASGATLDHTPNPVFAQLKPLGSHSAKHPPHRRRTAPAT